MIFILFSKTQVESRNEKSVFLNFGSMVRSKKHFFDMLGGFQNMQKCLFSKKRLSRGDFKINFCWSRRDIFIKNDVFLLFFLYRLSQGVFEKCLKSKFSQEQKSSKRAKKKPSLKLQKTSVFWNLFNRVILD